MKKIILIFLIVTSIFADNNNQNYPELSGLIPLELQQKELIKLDQEFTEKWYPFIRNQNNNEWVEQNKNLKVAGPLYSKGMFQTKVLRQIMPDREGGWMTIDTLSIGQHMLEKGAILAGNILLHYFVPYVNLGFGVIKEKNIVNIRTSQTYEEAIMLPPYMTSNIPLTAQKALEMKEGEIINTMSVGGYYVRAGGGIMNMIGIQLPAHINLGPKSKLSIRNALKVTISKDGDNHALIAVENANEKESGIGFGIGIFTDDIMDIPVSIGINSASGFYPLLINHKLTATKTHSVLYRVDLTTEKGKIAYEKFIQRDLTALDDYSQENSQDVVREMVKDGVISQTETNFAINLIFWRLGKRSIYTDGLYKTTTRNGNIYHYEEVSKQYITNKKSWSGTEDSEDKYSVLIPLAVHVKDKNDSKHSPFDQSSLGTFVLDTSFFYQDSETDGDEINDLNEELAEKGNLLKIPLKVDEDKEYGSVLVKVNVRFTPKGISKILKSTERQRIIALGTVFGMADPYKLLDRRYRRDLEDSDNYKERKVGYRTRRILSWLKSIDKEKTLADKAKYIVKKLSDGSTGSTFHYALMELAGVDQLIVSGFIKGKNF